jgi:hypothetical protein
MNTRIRATPRSVGEARAAARSENDARATTAKAMIPPISAPKKSIARTPNVTRRPDENEFAELTGSPRIRLASAEPRSMPVRSANGQASPVNGEMNPTATPTRRWTEMRNPAAPDSARRLAASMSPLCNEPGCGGIDA